MARRVKTYHLHLTYRSGEGFFYRNARAGQHPPADAEWIGPYRYPRLAVEAWCDVFVKPRQPVGEPFYLDVSLIAHFSSRQDHARVDLLFDDFQTDRDISYLPA